ncbi:MAG: carboxylate--amine ligase [Methanobacteriales archaeon Met13]
MKLMFIGSRLFEDVALYTKKKGITSVLTESNPKSPNTELADILHLVPRGMDGPKEIALKEDVDGVVPLIGVDGPLLSLAGLKEDLEENYGLPVVTSPLKAALLAQDKLKTKKFMVENDLPTPQFQKIDQNSSELPFDFPVVLKQRHGQGGQGIEIANTNLEVQKYLKKFRSALAEKFLDGAEISVEILGWDGNYIPLVPVYKGDTTRKGTHPQFKIKKAPLELECIDNHENNQRIHDLAFKFTKLMGIEGSADLDIIFDGKNNLILEINTRPSGTRYLTAASCNINPLHEMVDMATGNWKLSRVKKNMKYYFAMEVPVKDYPTKRNSYIYRDFSRNNEWIIHGPLKHQRITIRGESQDDVLRTFQNLKLKNINGE